MHCSDRRHPVTLEAARCRIRNGAREKKPSFGPCLSGGAADPSHDALKKSRTDFSSLCTSLASLICLVRLDDRRENRAICPEALTQGTHFAKGSAKRRLENGSRREGSVHFPSRVSRGLRLGLEPREWKWTLAVTGQLKLKVDRGRDRAVLLISPHL